MRRLCRSTTNSTHRAKVSQRPKDFSQHLYTKTRHHPRDFPTKPTPPRVFVSKRPPPQDPQRHHQSTSNRKEPFPSTRNPFLLYKHATRQHELYRRQHHLQLLKHRRPLPRSKLYDLPKLHPHLPKTTTPLSNKDPQPKGSHQATSTNNRTPPRPHLPLTNTNPL